MPFIKCEECKSVVHVSPVDEEEFQERFIDGNESYFCFKCFKQQKVDATHSDDKTPTHKCVDCGKEINIDYFKDYDTDDYGEFWCISCAERESDIGEIY